MAIFSKYKKEYTKENNLNKKGQEHYACWAHRKNYHLYEETRMKGPDGKYIIIRQCKCGAVLPEKEVMKDALKKSVANK